MSKGGPSNGWEEMAMWTEQHKLWQYPIDNECCHTDEQNVCTSIKRCIAVRLAGSRTCLWNVNSTPWAFPSRALCAIS